MTHNEESLVVKYGGRSRRLFKRPCSHCHKDMYAPKSHDGHTRYCSIACSTQARILATNVEVECAVCHVKMQRPRSQLKRSRHGVYFCSSKCKNFGQSIDGNCPSIQPAHYGTGEYKYRVRALKHYGPKCMRCGYTQFIQMLDVHHRDGNRKHNKIQNLEVVCVWCHALETRGVPPHVHLVPSIGLEPITSTV